VAAEAIGTVDDAERLGADVVERLKGLGALDLLPAPD
jgi:hypothetical protein